MLKQFSIVFAAAAMSTAAFGQWPTLLTATYDDGFYQLGYAANLNVGDSVINLSNDGFNGGVYGATPASLGNMCANVYVFDPQEEEVACCSCLVTPNGLNSLSAKNDLINNVLTPAIPSSIVIKITGTEPTVDKTGAFSICNPATAGTNGFNPLEYGLVVWGSTLEPSGTAGTYNAVNVPYKEGLLSPTGGGWLKIDETGIAGGLPIVPGHELAGLTQLCAFIQVEGTGYGICGSCRTGALSGTKQ